MSPNETRRVGAACSVALLVLLPCSRIEAQVAARAEQKISELEGGLMAPLDFGGRFGLTVAPLGDLDGDGFGDLAVGAEGELEGGVSYGALHVLFLNDDGTVKAERTIGLGQGGFGGALEPRDRFAAAVAHLGDLDGPGPAPGAVAVGAILDDDGGDSGGADRGAVWILFLAADGTVLAETKISQAAGGFGGVLSDDDWFGVSVTSLGDLDGAGPSSLALAVGALLDDDGGAPGSNRGAVWVLFLASDGTVLSEQKISATQGDFTGELDENDHFGRKVAGLGDLDGDGLIELAVGSPGDDDGGLDRGAVWVLSITPDGRVAHSVKISTSAGCFAGALDDADGFGRGLGVAGDVDGDGVVDLWVGAIRDDDGGTSQGANRGAAWLLFLKPDGCVRAHVKLSQTAGGFGGMLDDQDVLGAAVKGIADQDGDGTLDLAVGAMGDDDGGTNRGAVWIVFLEPAEPVSLGERTCCPAVPNSSGQPGVLTVRGSTQVADDDLTLTATQLPPTGGIGYFVMGSGQNTFTPPGSVGPLCVAPGLLRFLPPVHNTADESGGFSRVVGTSGPVSSNITPGSTWSFQAWHRDGMNPSNLTDAVQVVFN